jgi:hypothetical protein
MQTTPIVTAPQKAGNYEGISSRDENRIWEAPSLINIPSELSLAPLVVINWNLYMEKNCKNTGK